MLERVPVLACCVVPSAVVVARCKACQVIADFDRVYSYIGVAMRKLADVAIYLFDVSVAPVDIHG